MESAISFIKIEKKMNFQNPL